MKYSPIAEIHAELGAKMTPLHGWSIPAGYPGGGQAEHRHTRKYCSIFDSSFCGKLRIAGPNCANELDQILYDPVSSLQTGKIRKNFLLSENGTFLDMLTVFRMADDDCFIITTPANILKVKKILEEKLPQEIAVQDLTEAIARLDLQGPEAENVLEEAGVELEDLPGSGCCGMIEIAEIRCIASSMEPYGERGFELFCSVDNAMDLWDELTCIEPVRPAGFTAAESLRIEMGYPEWGTEITPELSPLDCGLELEAPQRTFAGSEALKTRKQQYYTVYVRLDSRQSAKSGDAVKLESGEEIGVVSSGTQAPSLDTACAICRIKAQYRLSVNEKILLQSGKTLLAAVVSEAPFVKK